MKCYESLQSTDTTFLYKLIIQLVIDFNNIYIYNYIHIFIIL